MLSGVTSRETANTALSYIHLRLSLGKKIRRVFCRVVFQIDFPTITYILSVQVIQSFGMVGVIESNN